MESITAFRNKFIVFLQYPFVFFHFFSRNRNKQRFVQYFMSVPFISAASIGLALMAFQAL
jgi:hypothetical protein